ncbi:hypothetical protein P152DRAFT_477722 [Eremomyces bilateralis CBS 781.70]|uniref:Peptidase S12 Pab87-related C-terminal domain-containing protein n=1 Tax=Eremomyces bilateralis CBS 781.70 TaxID=1392243 RepID=A0A6G1FQQ2_9PEZI|nr:uncharacterized protein P152DRAFT_477722 [Eremomyces bilateralis CBS 781.70]KAF1807982.1 hypothetical protein P152DRAFT_477722 [Eremomyces bilateralis CBS 781.70]
MPRHDLSYGGPNWTVRDIVRHMRHLPLTAEIRAKWQYCNMMFITLSHVVETVTNMWLRAMSEMDPRVLSEESYTALRTPRMFITIFEGLEVFSHNGLVTGFSTTMIYIPELSWGAALMSNGDRFESFGQDRIVYTMIYDLLGVPASKRVDWIARANKSIQGAKDAWNNSKSHLFPNAPQGDRRIPLPLPLASYSGTYRNAGYQNITLQIRDRPSWLDAVDEKILVANITDRTWAHSLSFEHIGAEHFLVWAVAGSMTPCATLEKLGIKGGFKVSAAGKVSHLGLAYEPPVGGEFIWFEKLA